MAVVDVHAAHAHEHAPTYEPNDQLMFGNFCLWCGNATQGPPYCSKECRDEDSRRALVLPEDSPLLSAVPPLVGSSSKSTSSSNPSSNANSPSPLTGMVGTLSIGDSDLPPLNLPAPVHKMPATYNSTPGTATSGSLPLNAHALSFALSYAANKDFKPSSVGGPATLVALPSLAFEDLPYRRKPNTPTHSVPAPLYFRQAAAHHSPALLPTSPAHSPARSHVPSRTPSSSAFENISAITLPPSQTSASGHKDVLGAQAAHGGSRRKSWAVSSSSSAPLYAQADDVLLSPRIRALRTERGPSSIAEEQALADDEGDEEEEEDNSSAFANFLFSHLGTSTIPTPSDSPVNLEDEDNKNSTSSGRRIGAPPELKHRSVSADSALVSARTQSTSRGRPNRFLFSRGQAVPTAADGDNAEDEGDEADDEDSFARPKLRPGYFIRATTDTPIDSVNPSPLPSPPASPPTRRGRSRSRKMSDAPSSDLYGDDEDPDDDSLQPPRGRSRIREGAIKRSRSPHREESLSLSRPPTSRSHSDVPRGRSSRKGGDEARDTIWGAVEEDDQEEEERGRSSRWSPRSTSRNREIVYSAAGYGHDSRFSP